MKKVLVVAILAGLLAFAGMAQAVPVSFTVNGISFDNLVGNNENFKWTVTPVAGPISFNLAVGGSNTFKYGSFYTDDFGIDGTDLDDNDDSFRANFDVVPPSPPSDLSHIGSPNANGEWEWFLVWYVDDQSATVNFDNTPIIVPFGTGGSYSVTFLDPATLYSDGSLDLKAKITLLSDSQAVPEPATMLLLGLGLLGVAGIRKFKKQ